MKLISLFFFCLLIVSIRMVVWLAYLLERCLRFGTYLFMGPGSFVYSLPSELGITRVVSGYKQTVASVL